MDLSQYVGIFVDEARLHLQQCSDALLALENAPDDQTFLNELFRSIHTIKGMAATLVEFAYFEEITRLSHNMETLLDSLRNHTLKLDERILDLLFACVDGLDILIGNISDPEHAMNQDLSYLSNHLEEYSSPAFVQNTPQAPPLDPLWENDWQHAYSESESTKILQAAKYGKNCFELRIKLLPNAAMKGVRSQVILNQLAENCEIIKTIPEQDELAEGIFEDTFIVSLVTVSEGEELVLVVESLAEVSAVKTINLLGETVFTSQSQENIQIEKTDFALPELTEIELNVLKTAKELGYGAILIGIRLFSNVVLKAARATLVFRSLEKHGDIIKSIPSVIELEEERFGDFFQVILITQSDTETIRNSILSIGEVKDSLEVMTLAIDESKILHLASQDESVAALPQTHPFPAVPKLQTKAQNNDIEGLSAKIPPPMLRFPGSRASPLVRVDAGKLEQLLRLVDELVMCRAELMYVTQDSQNQEIEQSLHSLGTVSTALHSLSIQLQMVSVEQVFNRFPRMIRDLSKSLGKEIDLVMEGHELEMDRTLIDELGNALMHMIRNAADHGLEQPDERTLNNKPTRGLIELHAAYESEVFRIDVRDDGRGIDTSKLRYKAVERGIVSEQSALQMTEEQALRLVFAPGLSTQDTATDISGRGVGMDAVRTQIESLGGDIQIQSVRGKGTCYTIMIPSQMKMLTALLVGISGQFYALSIEYIEKVTEIYFSEIIMKDNSEFCQFADQEIPVIALSDHVYAHDLEKTHVTANRAGKWLVIVKAQQQYLGLLVDEIIGQEQLLLKPVRQQGQTTGRDLFLGATVLGNDEVALLIDLPLLLNRVQIPVGKNSP
jgi:two-component system, chemotaxis family, sensor kinase CheA